MPIKGRARRMAGGQNAPAAILDDPVALTDGRKRSRQRHAQPIGIDQGTVPGRRGALGQPLFVKHDHWS